MSHPLPRRPMVIWIYGLPCAGKTTLGDALAIRLKEAGHDVARLDGDDVRSVIGNVGYSAAERKLHLRYMAYCAAMLERHGVTVIATFITPHVESREFARGCCATFFEVYLSTPLPVCQSRDVKGLYHDARTGFRSGVTGVDGEFEAPQRVDLTLDTSELPVEQGVDCIMHCVHPPCEP